MMFDLWVHDQTALLFKANRADNNKGHFAALKVKASVGAAKSYTCIFIKHSMIMGRLLPCG